MVKPGVSISPAFNWYRFVTDRQRDGQTELRWLIRAKHYTCYFAIKAGVN